MSKTKLHGQNYVLQNGNRASSVTTIINAMLGWNKNTLIAWAKRMTAQGEDADAAKPLPSVPSGSSGCPAEFVVEPAASGCGA